MNQHKKKKKCHQNLQLLKCNNVIHSHFPNQQDGVGNATGGNKAQKRAEHNAIERARRECLNTKFQQLAHSLPNLQNDRRPSKGTIIERTLEYGE